MTATMTDTPPPAAPKADSGRSRSGRSVGRILTILAGGLILVALVRVITGADQLTSEGQVSAALGLAVPIGLAGLAGLWSERSGVVNIGLEGMMILGTFGAGWIGWQTNPWLGLLCGIGFGVLGGLVHAVATVTFGVDHIVSGVAVNLLALGTTQYLAKLFFSEGKAADAGGNPKQSPPVDSLPTFDFPGLSDALKSVENHHWFVISDLAGILGGLVTDLSVVTILAVVLFVASGWLLWRTPSACGCAPAVRTRSPRSRSVSTSTGTSTWPWRSPAASPDSAAPSSHWSPRTPTWRTRPAGAATSASRP